MTSPPPDKTRTAPLGRPRIPRASYVLWAIGIALILAAAIIPGVPRAGADAGFAIGFVCIVAGPLVVMRSGALGRKGDYVPDIGNPGSGPASGP